MCVAALTFSFTYAQTKKDPLFIVTPKDSIIYLKEDSDICNFLSGKVYKKGFTFEIPFDKCFRVYSRDAYGKVWSF